MSETLPSQQNESQPWKQELQLHSERKDFLNSKEQFALLGSKIGRELANAKSNLEAHNAYSDTVYTQATIVQRSAMEQLELARQQSTTEEYQGESARLLIEIRSDELIEKWKKADSNQREREKVNEQLGGINYLLKAYEGIDDTIRDAAHGKPVAERQRAGSEAINKLIQEHNEFVAESTEAITDSPEIHEAQERINARYAEQAKQPQPTETVDDARQKVAEVFGGTGEKERQTLIGEVLSAAKGSARIHTSVTMKAKLGFRNREEGDTAYNDGFSDFGDGLDWGNFQWQDEGMFLKDTPEAFIFEPATTTRKKTVTKTIETGGRFRKKIEQIEEEVPDGEVPTMVVNPATDRQEPGIKVRYQFDSGSDNKAWINRTLEKNDLPAYTPPDNNRAGNVLKIEVTLPKTVADTLKQAALHNPDIARQFAQSIVTENGATEATVKMPPYTELPTDWKMTIAELQKDTFSYRNKIRTQRNVANQQDIKVQ